MLAPCSRASAREQTGYATGGREWGQTLPPAILTQAIAGAAVLGSVVELPVVVPVRVVVAVLVDPVLEVPVVAP